MKKRVFSDIFFILAAAAIFSAGVHFFISPAKLAPGGVTGAAVILARFTAFGVGGLIFLLNVPLFVLGFVFLERAVMLKTVLAVAAVTAFTELSERFLPVYGGGEQLLAAVFGGACMGLGLGLCYLRDATTGGSDILTKIISEFRPEARLGTIQAALDVPVVAAGYFVFGDINGVLCAAAAIFVQSAIIDRILYGSGESRMMLIFSAKTEEIGEKMLKKGAGVTYLNGEGGYTRVPMKIAAAAVRRQEYGKLKRMIRETDPQAFVISAGTREVLGKGFAPFPRRGK